MLNGINKYESASTLAAHISSFKITIGILLTISMSIVSGCNSDSGNENFYGPWTPGEAPDGGWTVPAIYEKAVNDGFSGSVAVLHRGVLILDEVAGLADRNAQIANTSTTLFSMGSITKQFTSALIMSLQQNGLLDVNDKLIDYFDDAPAHMANITIHQLMTHSAGIRGELGEDDDETTREKFLSLAWATPLRFEPGIEFLYSNAGYSLVALIAEKASGLSYEAALREYLLLPAGINDTGYVMPDWAGRTVAIGYNRSGSRPGISNWDEDGPYWNLQGNGGLLTTTSDMLKWSDLMSGNGFLTADSIEQLQGSLIEIPIEKPLYYGYGWVTETTDSGPVHRHNGTNDYHYSTIFQFPEEELVIILLSNARNPVSLYLPQILARTAAPGIGSWTERD